MNQHNSPQAFWLESLGGASHYSTWVFDLIAKEISGRVLEIGCGIGTYTKMIAPLAESVVAIDIEPTFVARARSVTSDLPNVEIRLVDFADMVAEEGFDTIVVLDVVEHLSDELTAIEKMFSLLEPGGCLVVKVPAIPFLFGEMDRAVGHFRRYTRTSLSASMRRGGLSPRRVEYMNVPGILPWWFNGRVRARSNPENVQIGLFNQLVPFFRSVEKLIRPPIGLSLIAIGEKSGAREIA